MDYITVRYIHVMAVSLSIAGFILRFAAEQSGAEWVRGRLARTVPHVNDTVLLVSAITLVSLAGMNPLYHPWLFAKIIALIVYIALGMLALNSTRSQGVRAVSGVFAVMVFSYIVSVALTKHTAGWLAFFI